MTLVFDWDSRKSRLNQSKHGVSFEEAQSVFLDDHALFMADPVHSDQEDRFLLLGLSSEVRVLVVCHCFRDEDGIIRIITARKANRLEQKLYVERRSS